MKITNEMRERIKLVTVMENLFCDDTYICKSEKSRNDWEVKKSENRYYCNCPAFHINRNICKHIIAVMIYENIPIEIEEKELK